MDAREAEQALAQVAQRRQQTIEAGTAPWSGKVLWSICSCILALGILADADMIWLWAVMMVFGWGVPALRGVRLRPTAASGPWKAALGATFALAVVAYVGVQGAFLALDWPLPATGGAVAAALTVALVSRPVQARLASSLRP